jgi:hypothetical protein
MTLYLYSYMSEDQHKAIKIYSVAHVIMFVVFVMHIFYWSMYETLIKWFCPSHNDVGDASDIKFRELQGLSAYVPQIQRKKILFPIICCDISTIPRRHFSMVIQSNFADIFDPKVMIVNYFNYEFMAFPEL